MAEIVYNDCSLPYPFHTSFSQEAEYDEIGKTDWYVTKFDITVQFLVNANYAGMLGVSGDNPAALMVALRKKLLEPRKTLSVKCNGNELIPLPQADGTVDAQNGPMPQFCQITNLTNATFLCTYRIVAKYWETAEQQEDGEGTGTATPGNDTLYNRWTETVAIDRRLYSTRTRTGKFVIRSDNVTQRSADEIRGQMAVTGIPQGFYRDSATYTVDPSGLGISYTLVDKEVWNNAPQGVHQAEGTYTESTTRRGFQRTGEVQLTMRGAKGTKVADLITTAVVTAAIKLRTSAAIAVKDGGLARLESGTLSVNLYDNVVTVNLKALLSPNKKLRLAGVASLNFNSFAKPVVNATQTPPAMTDRGSAALFLQAAAYYDPSIQGTTLSQLTGQLTNGNVPGTEG
jgi:hypothetical protein